MSVVLSTTTVFGVGLDVDRLTLLASVLQYMSLLPFMVVSMVSSIPLLLKTAGVVTSHVGTTVINCNL